VLAGPFCGLSKEVHLLRLSKDERSATSPVPARAVCLVALHPLPCHAGGVIGVLIGGTNRIAGMPAPIAYVLAAAILVIAVMFAVMFGRRSGRQALTQRLTALGSRLGLNPPTEESGLENALAYLEQVTGAASEAVAEASADAIRLRRAIDALPQGVVLCDDSGKVVYQNAPANALMTSRLGDALAAHAVTELLEEAWHDGTAERTLDLYGPPPRTLNVRALLIDDGRRSLGVIALIDDISERRRLEMVRRDFVANVSHELKTPMGALGLLAETLVVEPDGEVAKRLANRIHTEAFRVSRIIDDLLDLSRIEAESAPPREPVLVSLVMAEAVERVRAAADQRGIAIVLYEPSPAVAVIGDRRQLVSALHALLENAVTYSYENSTVTVSGTSSRESIGEDITEPVADEPSLVLNNGSVVGAVAHHPAATGAPGPTVTGSAPTPPPAPPTFAPTVIRPPGNIDPNLSGELQRSDNERDIVRISVADHGLGIPGRDLERIFERFYRVDHGRSRNTGGTGLGLSIVRHVANNHQGRVEVDSREGEGSTFTLVLPLQQDRGT
jgi:two-component system, OmpR family, sensor histidine kinase SenX3